MTAPESPIPLVDVCMPTYRRPRYLPYAVESVLAQTHQDWRLTISEDGPGDAEEVVAPYLADPRIRYVKSGAERLGGGGNHTKLLSLATGTYVTFLHDDDLWDPEMLARRVAFLEAHPTCGYVFSANTQIDEDGHEIGRSRLVLPEGLYQPEDFVPILLRGCVVGGVHTTLTRRAAFETVGPSFDTRFTFYDWEMWLRLAVRFPVGYLEAWDAHYRIHGVQVSVQARWGEHRIEFFELLDKHVEEHVPQAGLTPAERGRRRAEACLSVALDAAEAGKRRTALAFLKDAATARPGALLGIKPVAIVATIIAGPAVRGLLRRGRARVRRRALHRGIERTARAS